jgi:hypothetical protein
VVFVLAAVAALLQQLIGLFDLCNGLPRKSCSRLSLFMATTGSKTFFFS